jgi:hypothetical protein
MPVTPPASVAQYYGVGGIWTGAGAVANHGSANFGGVKGQGGNLCTLRLELRDGKDGEVTGESTLACNLFSLSYKPKVDVTLTRVKGTSVNGSALLHDDELIDRTKDSTGCKMTSIVLTRLMANTAVVQWHDTPPCRGGQMNMGKR